MANIEISNLLNVERVQSEELLSAVSDSVARAIKARGEGGTLDPTILGRTEFGPITLGIVGYPTYPPKTPTV